MSFAPKALVNVITCRHCKGEGCSYCQNQGVHGEMEGQTLVFDAPLSLAIKDRKRARWIYYLKRGVLYLAALIVIVFIWKYLVFNT